MRLIALNGILLALIAVAIAGFGLLGRSDAAISASVRRYAEAMSSSDLQAALEEIAPDQRDHWKPWIEGQLGNVYEVRGVAVRSPALLNRGTGEPYEVSIVLDVNREYPDWFFQPTPRVPVERQNGRWYLSRPPLADRDLEIRAESGSP